MVLVSDRQSDLQGAARRRPDRCYWRFTIGAFALVGVAAIGGLSYQPLRHRYVLNSLRRATEAQADHAPDWCVAECVKKAGRQDRQAMDVVVRYFAPRVSTHHEWGARPVYTYWDDRRNSREDAGGGLYLLSIRDLQTLISVLDAMPDELTLRVLWAISDSAQGVVHPGRRPQDLASGADARSLAVSFEECMGPNDLNDPTVAEISRGCAAYVRRRFARDLAKRQAGAKD
jgi:hypothetical protein